MYYGGPTLQSRTYKCKNSHHFVLYKQLFIQDDSFLTPSVQRRTPLLYSIDIRMDLDLIVPTRARAGKDQASAPIGIDTSAR